MRPSSKVGRLVFSEDNAGSNPVGRSNSSRSSMDEHRTTNADRCRFESCREVHLVPRPEVRTIAARVLQEWLRTSEIGILATDSKQGVGESGRAGERSEQPARRLNSARAGHSPKWARRRAPSPPALEAGNRWFKSTHPDQSASRAPIGRDVERLREGTLVISPCCGIFAIWRRRASTTSWCGAPSLLGRVGQKRDTDLCERAAGLFIA
jgi:hypothetical protein